MTTLSLVMTMAFVFVVMIISLWQRLDVEKDLLIGTIRAAVQLLAVGYVLLWVFKAESLPATLALISVMVGAAVPNAARRGKGIPGVMPRVLAALVLTELVTVGLMVALRIIPPTPQYLISISGMVIGSAMINAGLLLNRMQGEVNARRGEIEVWLALGATPRQASTAVLKSAVKAAMIPSIDTMKTVGLVQLPGMMTGQILAGASPLLAVKYQILIVYSLSASAAVTSITLAFLVLGRFFNRAAQLVR